MGRGHSGQIFFFLLGSLDESVSRFLNFQALFFDMSVEKITVVSFLLGGLLEAKLILDQEEVRLEIVPSLFVGRFLHPFLTILKIHARLVDEMVGIGEDLTPAIGLVTIEGKLLSRLDLIDQDFEWLRGIPILPKQFVIRDESLRGDFSIMVEQVL